MAEEQYTVYVRTDGEGRILDIGSDAFLRSVDGWTAIDSGCGDRYRHAQGNYLPGPLRDVYGVCRYKLVEGKPEERTQEEMDADYVVPEPKPTTEERVAQLEAQNEALLECLLEMSEIVYA